MRRPNFRSLLMTGAITAGLLAVLAPTASAEPISETTIKSECSSAQGSYTTTVKGGHRYSACTYADIDGDVWVDYYADGSYYGTKPVQPTRPA
jgi:hypothetical protein